MPALEVMDLEQSVILWEYRGVDKFNETVRTRQAEPLGVRLVLRARSVPAQDGTPVSIDGSMATDREVPLNSLVWEGEWANWDPTNAEQTILEVSHLLGRARDLKGRETRWEYGLTFYKGSPPEGVV